jgi:hypothetical protein
VETPQAFHACRHSFDALLCTLKTYIRISIGHSNRERERCGFPAKISKHHRYRIAEQRTA